MTEREPGHYWVRIGRSEPVVGLYHSVPIWASSPPTMHWEAAGYRGVFQDSHVTVLSPKLEPPVPVKEGA